MTDALCKFIVFLLLFIITVKLLFAWVWMCMCEFVLFSDGNLFCYTRHEPIGVVGAITPVIESD